MPLKIHRGDKIYGIVSSKNEEADEKALQPTRIANHLPVDAVHNDIYED
jgi:hypothetical protein